MACYHPLLAVPYPSSHPKYGQYRILGSALQNNSSGFMVKMPGVDLETGVDLRTGEYLKPIRLPCGKCIGCRLDYSRQWAARIQMEALDYPGKCWFMTLTYSNEDPDLPRNEDGTLILNPKHTQDWLKRYRIQHERKYGVQSTVIDPVSLTERPGALRYYLAGEYGDHSQRPHYHACMMNTTIPDLKPWNTNAMGDQLYTSDFVNQTWGHGYVIIGEMNYKTAAYTARYTMKKAKGETNEYFESMNMTPEFVRMSRKPGIGLAYLYEHGSEIYTNDEIILPAVSKDKPNVHKPPRYFDDKYKAIDPKAVAVAKARRAAIAELQQKITTEKTDLDEAGYFAVKEKAAEDRLKKLIRDL